MASRDIAAELENPLEETLGYHVQRAADAAQEAATLALARLDLRLISAVVMQLIEANHGCNQSSIARALGVQRTNLVPVMVDLEGRGLICRQPADGRSNALSLTEAGKRLLSEANAVLKAIDAACYGDIPPRLRNRMVQHLRAVRQNAAANS